MTKSAVLFFSFILIINLSFGQKLVWTSSFGGDNSNGSIVEYDIMTDQVSTKYSLGGNPTIGSNVVLNSDSWEHPGSLMKAQDGYYYSVSSLSGIATTNLNYFNNTYPNNAHGIFYRIDPSNYDVKVLHVFEGRNEFMNGRPSLVATSAYNNELSSPVFEPIEHAPGVFLGLCQEGGTSDAGGIYKFNVSTGEYAHLVSFDKSIHGEGVFSNLIKGDGDNYYGVMKTKNGANNGYLYRFNSTTNQLDFIKDLNDATAGILWVINNAKGTLIYDSFLNILVGVKDRFDVSSNWGGGCFAYNITTGNIENRFTIDYSNLSVLGSMPQGVTRGGNGKFYIVTLTGGAHNNGTIIEYDYQNNVPIKVHDFPAYSSANGFVSGEGMQVIGSKIYGFYAINGDDGKYSMWSYDYVSSTFNSFLPSDKSSFGAGIQTSFIQDNGKIIGQSVFNGPGEVGTFFELNPTNGEVTIKKERQSAQGRNLVGDVNIYNHQLLATVNKGGGIESHYTECGGYLQLDLSTNQSNLILGKHNIFSNNLSNSFQLSGMDTTENKLYQLVSLNKEFIYLKEFVSTDLSTGHHTSIKFYESTPYLTSPINFQGKVYFGLEDSIHIFDPASGQFETSSFIGDPAMNGWVRGGLTVASDDLFYGHTANLYQDQAKSSIFSFDPATGTTVILAEFDTLCRSLNTSLTEYNNKLYGMSNYGGTNSHGYIFAYDMASQQVDTVYNFNGDTDGRVFEGALSVYNDMLYALSYSGGQNGNGTLVQFDPSNSTLTTLQDLTLENGRAFKATPTYWDDSNVSLAENNSDKIDFTLTPNPTKNNFAVNFEDYDNITIYNLSGQAVASYKKSSLYDVSDLETGIYIVRLLKNKQVVGNEKLMISK